MVGENIVNKRATVKDIMYIADLCDAENTRLKNNKQSEEERVARLEGQNIPYNEIKKVSYYSQLTFSIVYKEGQKISKDDECEWFKKTLEQEAKNIKQASIYFYTSEGVAFENHDVGDNISVDFYEDDIYLKVSFSNKEYSQLGDDIEKHLQSLTERYDKTIREDGRRVFIPSLCVGIPLGIVLSLALFLLYSLDLIGSNFLLENNISYIAVAIILSLFFGSILPNKNTALYKNFKFRKTFNYNSSKNKYLEGNDYEDFKKHDEVAIGDNINLPEIRQQIEENYKKSKSKCLVMAILLIVECILFIIL